MKFTIPLKTEKTILKVYAEFEITSEGIVPITQKSWFDYPTKKMKKETPKIRLDSFTQESELM